MAWIFGLRIYKKRKGFENTEDYKLDIRQTRNGCLGSSDGRTLLQIASLGEVPKSAYKRMAVVNGLIPQVEIPRNDAIQAGDDLEMIVFNHLKSQDERYESNPLWVSKRYSKKNVKLISHPDFVLVDEEKKVINVYEVKATKYDIETTRQTYKAQLFIHNLIAKEKAMERGKDWGVRLFLVHYSTDGLDLSNGIEFDVNRLTIRRVKFSTPFFDIDKAMAISDVFLETFTEYYEGDEVDANLLPTQIKSQFDCVASMLSEIKEREQKVADFKARLYDFMLEKNIKSIKNEEFSITRVDATITKMFDAKRYVEDLKKEHPRKAMKIISQYAKETKKNGYVTIKVKSDKQK